MDYIGWIKSLTLLEYILDLSARTKAVHYVYI